MQEIRRRESSYSRRNPVVLTYSPACLKLPVSSLIIPWTESGSRFLIRYHENLFLHAMQNWLCIFYIFFSSFCFIFLSWEWLFFSFFFLFSLFNKNMVRLCPIEEIIIIGWWYEWQLCWLWLHFTYDSFITIIFLLIRANYSLYNLYKLYLIRIILLMKS